MEPTVNLGFLGLRHDDIRGVQRGYGDRFEVINNPDDTQAAATVLSPVGGQTERGLSLDSTSDTDWFRFSANAGDTLDVTLAPVGLTYPEGNDPISGLCASATPSTLNSRVESVAPTGRLFTRRNVGGDATDSDPSPTSGRTVAFSLAAGVSDLSWDAGLRP